MRQAFFVPSRQTEIEEAVDDPPISTPGWDLIFEGKVKRADGPLRRTITSKWPNVFQASGPKPRGDDALERLLRSSEKRENLLQTLANTHTAISSHNAMKLKHLGKLFEAIEERGLVNQSTADLEHLRSIKNSLENAQASVTLAQREFLSTASLLRTLADLTYSNDISRAFDPSLDPTARGKLVTSLFTKMRPLYPEMKLNMPIDAPAQNLLDARSSLARIESFVNDMQQLPTLTQDSRLPDLSALEDYCYERLPTATSIRVLNFGPPEHRDVQSNLISLSFRVVDLQDGPAFNALSYVWGDHRPPLSQAYNHKRSQRCFHIICDGRKIPVTYNLFCALRQLSASHNEPLVEVRKLGIWIDQLCIKQSDLSERSQQVSIMDRIYGQAKTVVSWLGEEDSFVETAVQLLDILADIPSEQYRDKSFEVGPFAQEIPSEQWLALGSLLSRPYFKRAWVVQEVALASQLLFLCGQKVILWESLVACSDFLQTTRAWTFLTKHAEVFSPVDDHIGSKEEQCPIRFGQQLFALLGVRAAIVQTKIVPEDLIFLGRQFNATDVKDKFYAMLGLARVRQDEFCAPLQLPPVAYEQSIEEVALAFATYHVMRSRGLMVLSLVEDCSYRINKTLPSWVPDPACPLRPLPLETDNLHDKASLSWNACGYREHTKLPVIDRRILIVQGYKIDVVKKAAIPFNGLFRSHQWSDLFNLLGSLVDQPLGGTTFDEAFWKTLITTTEHSHGKNASSTTDLALDFSEWIISLLHSIQEVPVKSFDKEFMALMMFLVYRANDLKFDIIAFGKPNNESTLDQSPETAYKSILQDPSTQLMFDAFNKVGAKTQSHDGQRRRDLAKQAEDSIHRLWESQPTGAFPNRSHIRSTLNALHPHKIDSPTRKEIQEHIDRFNNAVGTKLESRRMFVTEESRLGMGPLSLEEGHGVWVLEGANVPFVLERLDEGRFRLIGQAYVYGVMHGEAVRHVGQNEFCEIKLE